MFLDFTDLTSSVTILNQSSTCTCVGCGFSLALWGAHTRLALYLRKDEMTSYDSKKRRDFELYKHTHTNTQTNKQKQHCNGASVVFSPMNGTALFNK